MRTEVHVHGSIFLCKGVRLSQVDQAIRPWLDYLDVQRDSHLREERLLMTMPWMYNVAHSASMGPRSIDRGNN